MRKFWLLSAGLVALSGSMFADNIWSGSSNGGSSYSGVHRQVWAHLHGMRPQTTDDGLFYGFHGVVPCVEHFTVCSGFRLSGTVPSSGRHFRMDPRTFRISAMCDGAGLVIPGQRTSQLDASRWKHHRLLLFKSCTSQQRRSGQRRLLAVSGGTVGNRHCSSSFQEEATARNISVLFADSRWQNTGSNFATWTLPSDGLPAVSGPRHFTRWVAPLVTPTPLHSPRR